jgi:predicted ABC-type ATPase
VARNYRSIENLKQVLPIGGRAYIFDNSRDNRAARRWVRTRDGAIARVADGIMPEWVEDAVTAPTPPKEKAPSR